MAKRLSLVMKARLKKIRIERGGHSPSKDVGCIMEVTSLLLGHPWTSEPPCVSGVIRNTMVAINDGEWSADERAKLKVLIPEIIETAPTKRRGGRVIRDVTHEYLALEQRRRTFVRSHSLLLRAGQATMERKIEVVRELLKVA